MNEDENIAYVSPGFYKSLVGLDDTDAKGQT